MSAYFYSLILGQLLHPFDEVSYCSCRQVNRLFALLCREICRDAAIIVPLISDNDLRHLPANLVSLRVATDTFLDVDLLPGTLESLSLLCRFNQPFVSRHLPRNLRHLSLGPHYNRRINVEDLPISLETLEVSCPENETIFDLRHLRNLRIFRSFSSSSTFLPASLIVLDLPEPCYCQEELPPGLQYLRYSDYVHLDEKAAGQLPRTLLSLVMKVNVKTYLPPCSLKNLPSSMTELAVSNLVIKDGHSLPSTLRKLKIAYSDYFPRNLSSLTCQTDPPCWNETRFPDGHEVLNQFLSECTSLRKLKVNFNTRGKSEFAYAPQLPFPSELRNLSLKNSSANLVLENFPRLEKLSLKNFSGNLRVENHSSFLSSFIFSGNPQGWELDSIPSNLRELVISGYDIDLNGLCSESPHLEIFCQEGEQKLQGEQLPLGLLQLKGERVICSDWNNFPRHLQHLSLNSLEDFNWDLAPLSFRTLTTETLTICEMLTDDIYNLPLLEKMTCEYVEEDSDDPSLPGNVEDVNLRGPCYLVHPDNLATRRQRLAKFLQRIDALTANLEVNPWQDHRDAYAKHGLAIAVPAVLKREYENYRDLLERER